MTESFDPKYDRLESDDEVYVDYDATPNDDGSKIEIRRTVWRKAYFKRDRDILFQATCALVSRDEAAKLMYEIAQSLAVL
jgi:hypothetical protein